MNARHSLLSISLLAGSLVATSADAQGTEYAAGTTRYRLTSTTKGTQASPMGSQDFQVDMREQLTVSIARRAADTVVATVTVDSLTLKSAAVPTDVSKLLGTKIVNFISPTGKLYSSQVAPSTDPMMGQVSDAISRFLPSFRRDLRTGFTWTDTTSGKMTQQGIELDRTMIANYTVLGDTTVGGEHAFQIQRKTSVKAAGSGMAQGQPVGIESATASTAKFFISPKGQYLGGGQSDDITVKVSILAQGVDINIKQTAQSTVETIR